jgi:hypothetical protein
VQWCVSGFKIETDPDKGLRISKKHDKQLTFIVRVSISASIGYEDFFLCLSVSYLLSVLSHAFLSNHVTLFKTSQTIE